MDLNTCIGELDDLGKALLACLEDGSPTEATPLLERRDALLKRLSGLLEASSTGQLEIHRRELLALGEQDRELGDRYADALAAIGRALSASHQRSINPSQDQDQGPVCLDRMA